MRSNPNEPNGLDPEKCAQLRKIGERDQVIAATLTELRAVRALVDDLLDELADMKRDLQASKRNGSRGSSKPRK